MSEHSRQIARNAAVVSAATMLSRVLGFVRDMIIAFALGAGPIADAFFVAFRVPNLLRSLFAEGSMTMAFVPVFTRTRRDQGQQAAHTLARSMGLWLLIILGAITLLAVTYARQLTGLIAPGFADTPQLLDLTAGLLKICFPYIIFISGVALCMGILNSQGHFLAPALAPCVLNCFLISAALISYFTGFPVAYGLAWGVFAAGIGQFMLQQPFLRKHGFSWKGTVQLLNKGVLRVGALMLPTVFGAAVYQVNILLGTLLASFLAAGSISYLYYADRLVQFPLGVFGVAISTAALPSLSALAAADKTDEFKKTINSALRLSLFISIPAAAGLIALCLPIVDTLFGRGEFTSQAATATAHALVGYSLGLPAYCCVKPLVSAFYAREDTKTPVAVACLCVAVNIGLGLVLMNFIGHVGLALASSASAWLNVLILGRLLRRKLGPWYRSEGVIPKITIISVGMGALAWAASFFGNPALLLIPVLAVVYFAAASVLGIEEADLLKEAVWTRLKKPRSKPRNS